MDEYIFNEHLQSCVSIVKESTTCFEALSIQGQESISLREKPLPMTKVDIEDFLHRRGDFEIPPGCQGGIRFILQVGVTHPETFEPKVLSLPQDLYMNMIQLMKLPLGWGETSSCVGPIFWSRIEATRDDEHLQIIYRKSDVKKKDVAKTRNWEMVLSHDRKTSITSGFFKGTERSDIMKCLACIKACTSTQICHPLLLPVLIFSYDMDAKEEKRHRDNRQKVRVLEDLVTVASHKYNDKDFTKADDIDLAKINSDLVDCHKEVLWKRPEGYLGIHDSLILTLRSLNEKWPEKSGDVDQMLEARMSLLKTKLEGIQTHRHITLSRLELIGNVLRNLVSLSIFNQEKSIEFEKIQRQQTLKVERAKEQHRGEIQRAQMDLDTLLETRKQTAMAILGIIFIPGAFISSLFSTTFFDFQTDENAGTVSKKFWVYWAFTIPITVTLLFGWFLWHRHTRKLLSERDEKIQEVEGVNMTRMNGILSQPYRAFSHG